MRVAQIFTLLCAALLIAGCGGGDDSSSTSGATTGATPGSIDGTYDVTTIVTETTFKEPAGKKSEKQLTFVFKCADDDCSQVYQRGEADPGAIQGRTYLFERDGDKWKSIGERSGPCTAPATGTYTERVEWIWTRDDDSTLEGEVDQTFTGCKLDGKAHFTATTGERGGDLAYLDGDAADKVKAELTAYDEVLTKAYRDFPGCQEQLGTDGKVVQGGTCFSAMLTTWQAGLTKLESYLSSEPAADAKGACAKALEAADSTAKMSSEATKASAALAASKTSGDYEPASKAISTMVTTATPQQNELTAIANRCIAPDDLEGLGDEGVLTLDTSKTVTILKGGAEQ